MATKKYQVFVSSTFVDLKDERQAVSRAILNLGHIPAGMELFPASDVDQMSFIKKVIDDCDYYILILGGRYGSLSESGLSYTELEYAYAVEQKKPVLAFLHGDTDNLKLKNVDTDRIQLEKLEAFRTAVKTGRIVEFWNSLENLESKALIALTNAFNEQPQLGWRRDTNELSMQAQRQLDMWRERYDSMRERYDREKSMSSVLNERLIGYESLEEASVEVRYQSEQQALSSVNIGAEDIIREFAASITSGITLLDIERGLESYLRHKVDNSVSQVALSSTQNVALFLEVYEICQKDGSNYVLLDTKKWLLKAAFKPLKKVIESYVQDEIPF
jgi:hypothetical protein